MGTEYQIRSVLRALDVLNAVSEHGAADLSISRPRLRLGRERVAQLGEDVMAIADNGSVILGGAPMASMAADRTR